jgi:pyrroloquinoline quinone biosynthesis protein B
VHVRVLGSAAGGGVPQWNCGGANSVRARSGDAQLAPRTQAGLAVSADGVRWSLLSASPDLRQQLAAFPALHPRPGTRDVPLDTVVLTSAELDVTLGLLSLREAQSYRVLSTPWVRNALFEHDAVFRLFEPAWGSARIDESVRLDREGRLEARFFPLAAKVPGYRRVLVRPAADTTGGVRGVDRASGKRLVFAPALGALDTATLAELAAADLRFVDGTFFTRDELRALRPGAPDALAMGHVPISGEGGSLTRLASLPGRTLYLHMNATNPIVDSHSEEAARVRAVGIEVAQDGQELSL